ncbi:MAG: L-threonylcarbamoyladenylate synthase [Proteobacteria bacterium]|nr:L-threonylcarbamoyladenylate synthase [Pseudomonadota bacterium]MDA1131822.1 L-threonylcarbamoyladenylate synthase [Pseudomonadota bacterium]
MAATTASSLAAPTADALARAADRIRAGGLVAFPTETVYGLGADATNAAAVQRLFRVKGRPALNPLIVHVADAAAAAAVATWSEPAHRLAAAFWPGALTLVLPHPAHSSLAAAVTAGQRTVAVRVPGHSIALDLLRRCGVPLAAPSANRSGRVSPTTAAHVAGDLGDAVDMILDAGPTLLGIESTVVALVATKAQLLRPGGIPRAAVEAVLGAPLTAPTDDTLRAPGMLASHYAPVAPVRLDAIGAGPGEALLAFGPDAPTAPGPALNLSPTGDLAEAAARLYAALRDLDRPEVAGIAVMPIPDTGIGAAINDRLRRAAAPRSAKPHR